MVRLQWPFEFLLAGIGLSAILAMFTIAQSSFGLGCLIILLRFSLMF